MMNCPKVAALVTEFFEGTMNAIDQARFKFHIWWCCNFVVKCAPPTSGAFVRMSKLTRQAHPWKVALSLPM